MRDLTEFFNKIFSHNNIESWSHREFYIVINKINELDDVTLSFWEGEENWGRIIVKENVIGYLWREYPLFVLDKKYEDLKLTWFIEPFCEYLLVESLIEEKFLLKVSNDKEGRFDGVNLKAFTIEDLWFFTNSI